MQKINWSLILPLVLLFGIGFAGFASQPWQPAIGAFIRDGVSEQWLGFFGNIIGALIALMAAAIAWIAAQRQIAFARQQSAVVAYQALCDTLQHIIEERPRIQRLTARIKDVHVISTRILGKLINAVTVEPNETGPLRESLGELELAISDFEQGQSRPWGDERAQQLRRASLDQVKQVLARGRSVHLLSPPRRVADWEAAVHRLGDAVTECKRSFGELDATIEREARLVRSHIDRNYAAFISH